MIWIVTWMTSQVADSSVPYIWHTRFYPDKTRFSGPETFAQTNSWRKGIYRVFINYCIFFFKMLEFFWTLSVLLERWCSTCLVCVHTLTPRENRERQEFGIYYNLPKKQYLISNISKKKNCFIDSITLWLCPDPDLGRSAATISGLWEPPLNSNLHSDSEILKIYDSHIKCLSLCPQHWR